jgi:hypothetical protein
MQLVTLQQVILKPVLQIRDMLVRIRILDGTFTSFFKDKKYKKAQTVEINGFLTILLDDGRIRSRIRNFCFAASGPEFGFC